MLQPEKFFWFSIISELFIAASLKISQIFGSLLTRRINYLNYCSNAAMADSLIFVCDRNEKCDEESFLKFFRLFKPKSRCSFQKFPELSSSSVFKQGSSTFAAQFFYHSHEGKATTAKCQESFKFLSPQQMVRSM